MYHAKHVGYKRVRLLMADGEPDELLVDEGCLAPAIRIFNELLRDTSL